MGTQPGQVVDEKFSNWVKDTLALLYTKECLEVIADERSAVFHGQLKTAVGNNSTCTCSWQALNIDRKQQKWVVKNCPGVCQNWLDHIISHHSNHPLPKLTPRNTDPGRWPSDTWEVMKVYQSNGCQGHRSERDADVAALIDLMRNCDHFAPLIRNPSLITQIITVRNNLMHSKDFKVETQELSRNLQSMLTFLRSLTAITGASSLSLTEHQAVQTAITEVDTLCTSILDMTLNRELQLKALKAKQVALETDMTVLEQTINDARADTAAVKYGLTDVEDKLSTEVQTLQQHLASQLSEIQDVKKDMTEQQQSAATVVSYLAHLQQKFDDLKLDHDETKKNITALKQQVSDLEVTSQNQQLESQAHACQLEKHQKELDTHTSTLSQLELRQGELDTHKPMLQDHATQLQGHQSQIESQHKTLECHEAKLGKLENKQIAQQTGQAVDIKGIQGKLIRMYEARRQHIPVYLLRSERKLRLEDIYVEQCLKVVDPDGRLRTDCTLNSRHQARLGIIRIKAEEGISEPRTSENVVSSLSDVFYSEGNKCRYIYVSGNAGYGKSVFCSHLVRLWCKAHSDQSTKLNPEEELMAKFPLLFCVDLRDATYAGTDQIPDEICSLIHKQLQLSQIGLTGNDLSQLLQAEGQVLVIMDALDECNEERLPREGLYNKCTTLVTSRPWKLEALRCDPECRMDKEIEIVGLKKGSPEDLSEKLVELLNKKWNKRKRSQEFIWKMRRKGLVDFLNVPVILTQMLCLWFDDIPFGKSQTEVYKNSIHHQILAAIKAKDMPEHSCLSETLFPICHGEKCPCKCYGELLWKVSELACKALLSNVRERSLVMDHDQTAFLGLSDKEVAICMKLGILTQYKLLGNVTDYEPQKSVSFTHKTYQEWFAAIYLSSKLPLSELDKLLSEAIIDLNSALELEHMYLFVCGLNAEVAAQLHGFIMSKVSSKKMVQDYQLIKTIQDLVVAGAVEAKKNNKVTTALQLHDVYIDGNFEMFSTEQIFACATSHVRSVYIEHVNIEKTGGEESSVEKNKITPWPSSSCLKKLHLRNITNALDDTFCNNFSAEQLVHLCLYNVTLTHDQLERLCASLALAGRLGTVEIVGLTCMTHTDNRQDCSIMLDLSQHQGLKDIILVNIGVGEMRRASLCQSMNNLVVGLSPITLSTVELENITLTHDGLVILFASLVKARGNLRIVVIRNITCKTHKVNKKLCYIDLEIYQFFRLDIICKVRWQRLPNVNSKLLPPSYYCIQKLDLQCVDYFPCDTFCDNFNLDNVPNIFLDNITMTHHQLQRLCESLASAGNLRTVEISQLVCKTHKENKKNCYVDLDISQYDSLKKLCEYGLQQLPNVNITSLPSPSYTETLVLRDSYISPHVTFCDNFIVGNVEEMCLDDIRETHDQLVIMFGSLASANSLRKIRISEPTCITHKDNIQDCNIMLDLSRHDGLEDLTLRNLDVGEVNLCQNMDKLMKVELEIITLNHDELEGLCANMASAGCLRTVYISKLTCITHKDNGQDCSFMLDLSQHQGLEDLTLWDMNVGDVQEVSLCQNMDKLEHFWLYNITLPHRRLESLCASLASAGNLRKVNIKELSCKTHEDNRHNCYINLDVSQYANLEKICQSGWQRPNVRITALPYSSMQTVDLRHAEMLQCDTFCDNFNIGNVVEIYLVDVKLTHCQLERLCASLALAGSLRKVDITQLNCMQHQDNRQDCSLMWDISQHQGLEDLILENLGVGELWGVSLHQNMSKLESIDLSNVTLTHAQLENLCRSLASAGSLKTVDIIWLTCITHKNNRQDCSFMLDLSQHQVLEDLTLWDLSVGEVQEVSLCQNMDKLEKIWLYNITLSHRGLESMCTSLASAGSLRTVNIRDLNCKTHEDNRHNCYINLDVSQYANLEKICQSGWQRPNVRITSSSSVQVVDLRCVEMLPCDIFCDNFNIGNVAEIYLVDVKVTHGQLERLCTSVALAGSLRTVDITQLICITHQDNRHDCRIMWDISKHQGLEDLTLENLGVGELWGVSLYHNMEKLESIDLRNVSLTHHQLESLASAGNLRIMHISKLACVTHKGSKQDCSMMLDLSKNEGLEDLILVNLGVGEVRGVILCQTMDKLRNVKLENMILTHDGLERTCVSLASVRSLRKADIRELTCKAHKDNIHNCYINLDISQYDRLGQICQSWWQRPNIRIHVTSLPSPSCTQTLNLHCVDILPFDTFCFDFNVGKVSNMYLCDITVTHDQLESLCGSFAAAVSLRIVDIKGLTCYTHKDNRQDCSTMLDLSQHQVLEGLTLVNIGVGVVRGINLYQKMDKLVKLEIANITLTHDGLERLYYSLASVGSLRKINIDELTCITHKDNRQDCNIMLDLSQHQGLEDLTLWNLSVSEVRGVSLCPNNHKLEKVDLGYVSLTHDEMESLFASLASEGNLRKVVIRYLTCITHIDIKLNCNINLDVFQYVRLQKRCQSVWQHRPKFRITSLPTSSSLQTVKIRFVDILPRDTFCVNFNVGIVSSMYLGNITATHDQLESLCASLASVGSLRKVYISTLTCITHKDNKQDCNIMFDLSRHHGLERLTLWNLGVGKVMRVNVCQNMHKLMTVELGIITLNHDDLEGLCARLATVRSLRTVYIAKLTCITHNDNRHDCGFMLDLSQHQGLEDLTLWDICVGEVQEVSLCQNMDKLEKIYLYDITLSHGGLECLCASLASAAGSLRTVNIRKLNCKTHEYHRRNCFINLNVSQYASLEKICKCGWQRPNVRVTSLPPSHCLQTLDLRSVNILPCDIFCDNFNVGKVAEIYLVDVKLTHGQLESLCASLALAGSLRTVEITQLICITHQDNRQDCSLMWDISHHQGLEDLTLENLGVGELWGVSLHQNMSKLESIDLSNVTLTHAQLENLCRSLASAGSLKTVDIIWLTCITHQNNGQDCSLMLDLSQHQGLEDLTLWDLSVGEVQEVSLCQKMDKLAKIWLYDITLSHAGLERLCVSLASAARSLRTVNIKELSCKTHEDDRQNCYINLDVSQYASLEKICQSGWQRPNVRITALPSSAMQTVDLRRVDILPTDIFCVGQQTRL